MGLTSSIDLAEILFTLFWVFFIALIIYLRREDKREGYPLDSDRSGSITVQGFPAMPKPKEFALTHGGSQFAPRDEPPGPELAARPAAPHLGAPLVPTGDPMKDAIGPGSYANRADTPDRTIDGKPRIVPMRSAESFHIDRRDPDPRGMPVMGADGKSAGTVSDIWVDLAEPMISYFEVELPEASGNRHVLLPIGFAKVNRRKGQIDVNAIYSHQFADVPALASEQQITCLEEDKVCAYYAGGTLYADASRQEPMF
jgi:photosynthetic reaction center H subunit